ncbi:MAG: NAD-dependent epimerase/dehydratase family protein [Chloroflexi bacterium]|jgi:UDP-glucuronate 4-epimerase|nr:NAD-dependent epimerase/dehydratase family protein [Chloroflexota bacterium]
MPNNYLITGVAGFIASRVAEMLLDAGHTVVGVDNLNDAYDVRMKDYRLECLQGKKSFQFIHLDISDKQILETLTRPNIPTFDAVINLAARAGVRASVEDPWVYVDTNMTGTLNLLELCNRTGVPKFILASTSSIYGGEAPLPTPETASSDLPLQAYAASKKGAEAMAHAYHYLNGLDVSIVRYFTVYGPAGRPDMSMFRFAKWISEGIPLRVNGDGEQSRGFTYVDDIARGTIQALKPVGYEIINLGGHENITINALIAIMEEMIGREAQITYHPLHPADALANRADVSKAGQLLGWEPQVSLREGIARLIEWYNENREWAREIDTD